MAGLSPASDREFSLGDSNLLSGWISYLRTGYRDSLINESHSMFSQLKPNTGFEHFNSGLTSVKIKLMA
ncbi:MAG: hypothetical protein V7K40_02780 [Nostoc sp.]